MYFVKGLWYNADMDEALYCYNLFRKKGTMIDVGAWMGTSLLPFVESGWEVYAFEPDLSNWLELTKRFGGRIYIDNRAVSNKPATNVTLYKSDQASSISSLAPFTDTHYAAIGVDVTTLTDFIKEQNIKKVDFLKIDTEGYDYFVLQGYPWKKAPKVILCEFEDSKTVPLGYTFKDMAEFLVSKGYDLLVSEWYPIKAYGTQHQWKRLVPYPCEIDENAWGNIIAIGKNFKNFF